MRGYAASVAVLLFVGLLSGGARAAAPAAKPTLLAPEVELVELTPVDQRYDQADDAKRLAMVSQRVRHALAGSSRYALLDRGPQDRHPPYRYADCKACVLSWARASGADFLLVAWVQKESRLILIVNLALIDLHHDHDSVGSVELRGDTDASWLAGAQQLLDRYLGIDTPL